MGMIDKLLELLTAAGVHCGKAFPNERMPLLEEPAVMVSTKQMQISPCAIDNHLGVYGDEVCVAALCEEEIFLHVYSPYLWGGRFCDTTTDRVLSAILNGITDCTFKSIHRTQSYYDPKTDCFRNEITVTVLSWMRLVEE